MPRNSDKYQASKQLLPTDLRSKEMSFLDRQLRERAFWSAGVENAKILSDIQSSIREVISGNFSETEARLKINETLNKHNYKAPVGTEGGIKDMYSYSRQKVLIKTNVEMANGYAQLEEAQEFIEDYPCFELVRAGRARVPRDWINGNDRWLANGGKLYNGRMIAEINDPIWVKISRFGNPYPPFDFNSSMVLDEISRKEAISLGVIAKDAEPKERAITPSINENLETKINAPEELLKKVEESFAGFAKRDGNKITFTDPNGTKPYSAKDIVNIIGASNLPNIYGGKDGSQYLQKNAFVKWIDDSHSQRYNPNLDITEDIGRLFERIEPMKEDSTIYRGLSFSSKDDENYKKLMAQIENNTFRTDSFNSCTTDYSVAESFASKNSFQVVLEFKKHNTAKDLKYLVGKYYDMASEEKEVMLLHKKSYRVINKKHTTSSNGMPLLKIELEVINE